MVSFILNVVYAFTFLWWLDLATILFGCFLISLSYCPTTKGSIQWDRDSGERFRLRHGIKCQVVLLWVFLGGAWRIRVSQWRRLRSGTHEGRTQGCHVSGAVEGQNFSMEAMASSVNAPRSKADICKVHWIWQVGGPWWPGQQQLPGGRQWDWCQNHAWVYWEWNCWVYNSDNPILKTMRAKL